MSFIESLQNKNLTDDKKANSSGINEFSFDCNAIGGYITLRTIHNDNLNINTARTIGFCGYDVDVQNYYYYVPLVINDKLVEINFDLLPYGSNVHKWAEGESKDNWEKFDDEFTKSLWENNLNQGVKDKINQYDLLIKSISIKSKEGDISKNWKTYINEKYKYSIKYPIDLDFLEDWQITEKTSDPNDNVAFVSKNPYEGGIEIIVKDKPYKNIFLKDWLVKNDIYGNIISLEEIIFNGSKSCKTYSKEPVNINTERIYFEKNSNLYQISFIGKGSDNREFEEIPTYSLFQEMFSTFKFTE